MSKVTDPQEKKRLSLAHDRRNSYGENDKSSRKNIPRSKALGHRIERRIVAEVLSHGHIAVSEDQAAISEGTVKTRTRIKKLKGFVKTPDQPLSENIAIKLACRKRLDRNGA